MTNGRRSEYRRVAAPDAQRRVLTDCLQASSRLYMFLARQTFEEVGTAGEAAVRESVRGYGVWRGSEMREAHISLGEPINVETLLRNWDSASTYVAKDEVEDQGSYAPHDVSFDVTYCPAALSWKEGEFHRWGHVYCDEFHQSAATAYHPDAMVTIPINMMKGDHRCAFRWVMPNQDERDTRPRPASEATALGDELSKLYARTDDESEGLRLALTRTNRLLGGRYQTFVSALEAELDPGTVRTIIEQGIARWSRDRGERLRHRLERQGAGEITGELAWQEMDLAPAFTWDAELQDRPGSALAASVASTPQDEVWQEYGTGEWGDLFWRVSLPALLTSLYPERAVRVETGADGSLGGFEVDR